MEFKDGKPVVKPVKEMTEAERIAMKDKVLKTVAENIVKGGKQTKVIVIDSEEYKGEIIIHRPTLNEIREIGIREAQYRLGIESLDVIANNICVYLATFDVIVDKAPDWWKPAEMYDYQLLNYVWEEYAAWRTTFRSFSKPKPAGDSKTTINETSVVDTEKI